MYKKDLLYCGTPFSDETPQEDFFLYGAVNNLRTKCENDKNKIIKIRTVGTLRNDYGYFYIKEMMATYDPSIPPDPRQSIQVSMAYMTKSIPSTNMPYPVQLFGRLQWCYHPVIFAEIVQPLDVSVAILLHETMNRAATLQSSSQVEFEHRHEFDG